MFLITIINILFQSRSETLFGYNNHMYLYICKVNLFTLSNIHKKYNNIIYKYFWTDKLTLFMKIIYYYYKIKITVSIFQAQTRLNHLGLYLSSERRLRLQDSAQEKNLKLLTENLKTQPLVKITGIN